MNNYISPEELHHLLAGAEPPLVIDVRGEESYATGHIPGAVHVTVEELSDKQHKFPRDRLVITY